MTRAGADVIQRGRPYEDEYINAHNQPTDS
jgi:hypothetical protein